MSTGPEPLKCPAPRISSAEWEKHRETITSRYQNENLKDLIKFMASNHEFTATKAQYVRKLESWGVKKNTSKETWRRLNSEIQSRKEMNKETDVQLFGRKITKRKLKKELGRRKHRESSAHVSESGQNRCTDIEVNTPPSNTGVNITVQIPSGNRVIRSDNLPSLTFQSSLMPIAQSLSSIFGVQNAFRNGEGYSTEMTVTPSPCAVDFEIRDSYGRKLIDYALFHAIYLSTNNLLSQGDFDKLLQRIVDTCNIHAWFFQQLCEMKGPTAEVLRSKLLLGALKLENVALVRGLLRKISTSYLNSELGSKALRLALETGNDHLLQLLLDQGFDPKSTCARWRYLLTLAFHAKRFNMQVVERLVFTDADPDTIADLLKFGSSHAATPSEFTGLVKLLLTKVYGQQDNRESLCYQHVADFSHFLKLAVGNSLITKTAVFEIAQGLIDRGADVNFPTCIRLWTREVRMSTIRRFGGMWTNTDNEIFWQTPLQCTTKRQRFDMVQMLLAWGADVNAVMLQHEIDQLRSDIVNTANGEGEDRPPDFWCAPSSALHHAVRNKDIETATALLEAGAHVEAIDDTTKTPLQAACARHSLPMARLLLRWGARVDVTNCQGLTAMHYAIESNNYQLVEMLMEHGAILQDSSFESTQELLRAAVKAGNIDLLTTLLPTSLEHLSADPTLLGISIYSKKDFQTTKFLLDLDIDANSLTLGKTRDNPDSQTWAPPLIVAFEARKIATVLLLIENGADINCLAPESVTPLSLDMGGKDSSHEKFVSLLLERGACTRHIVEGFLPQAETNDDGLQMLVERGFDINRHGPNSCTALQVALRQEKYLQAFYLLEHGANPNEWTEGISCPPLHHAAWQSKRNRCWESQRSLLRLLLDRGAQVDVYANVGLGLLADEGFDLLEDEDFDIDILDFFCESQMLVTALQLACSCTKNNISIINALLEAGADINAPAAENYGCTALQASIWAGNDTVTQLLLEQGAQVNADASKIRGITALQAAAFRNNHQLVRDLLEGGADVNSPACLDEGATALQWAAMKGNLPMAIDLLEAGADINAARAEFYGRTALEGAAEQGRLDIVLLLLQNDHEVEGLEERCASAARYADREGHMDIARILREWKGPYKS